MTIMATMNFSIPDDLKEAFNKTFEGENKSAIVSGLMRDAVAAKKRRARQDAELDTLMAELLRVRGEDEPLSDDEIRRIRHEGRP